MHTYVPGSGLFIVLQKEIIWVHDVHVVNKIEINHKMQYTMP